MSGNPLVVKARMGVRSPPPARYVEFDATERELDELVSFLEDHPPLRNFKEAADEAARKGLRITWGTPIVKRTDHRGNPLEVHLPGIPAVYSYRSDPILTLNGWMMLERHDYALLFTQGGALVVFPLDLWNTVRLRHGGSPLVLSWYENGELKARAFDL